MEVRNYFFSYQNVVIYDLTELKGIVICKKEVLNNVHKTPPSYKRYASLLFMADSSYKNKEL